MSEIWDKVWRQPVSRTRPYWYAEEFLHYLIRWSAGKEKALFLEIGAGSGQFSDHLSIRGIEVVALDYSRNSIRLMRRMRKNGGASFHIVRADARGMPFRNSTFSVIFSEGLLEHFRNPGGLVTEAVRVLQKHGITIFAVPNKFSFHTIGRGIATRLLKLQWVYGYEASYSKWELRHLLNSVGLRNIEIHGIGLLYGVGRYMPPEMHPLFYGVYIRIRQSKLGNFLTERLGFQITAKAEKIANSAS